MAKWPNHFISGKQFQKRPNGNPASILSPHFLALSPLFFKGNNGQLLHSTKTKAVSSLGDCKKLIFRG